MCMYTCTCMSCMYSMSWIHRYMYISIRSPSRYHLAGCQRRRWQYKRLEIFVWESRSNWGSWTSWSFCSFWEPQSCPPNRPTFLRPSGAKIEFVVLAGKKSVSSERGELLAPPPGEPYRNGEFFFFWFWIHTASAPSTVGTHTDGGAVIRKPGSAWLEGTPAISIILIFYFMIVFLKWTFAYADIQTEFQ